MADDLILGDNESEDVEVEAEDGYVEYTSITDYITCAYNAWEMANGVDTMILSKADEKRVRRIKRQSLRIVSQCLNDLYEELFDDNNDDDSD